MQRDWKYLAAYVVPASAGVALWLGGGWAWSTVVLVFGILPLFEQILPQSTANTPEVDEPARTARPLFDWLLYLNVPIVFGTAFAYFEVVTSQALGTWEWLGMTLSAGIVLGANGINVAHELGHRSQRSEQWLAQALLLPNLYQHFFVEHNLGHHKHVATDRDPASARKGQNVYAFWWQSVIGSWQSAWQIERQRLSQQGQPFWGWHNQMLRFSLAQAGWLVLVGLVWGWAVLPSALAVALVGVLLLETVNYIEHYGLRRRLLPSGRPEPVSPCHSWNSDHELGRIFLYELTRHSDHHFKATRKYQILRHLDESPQLPAGYPASMLLALAPPLWFWVMNPRVPAV